MYLDSYDYQTIWKLAHNWSNVNAETSDENNLTTEVIIFIHRIIAAINRRKLTARTRDIQIFQDESFISFIFDLAHIRKLNKSLKKDVFKKDYLDSLYVRRSEVLAWCEADYLNPPPIWQLKNNLSNSESYDNTDDENVNWYSELTEARKKRVACLELAKKLWLISPNLTYEEIYNHPTMKQFGNPTVFSLDAFKSWSRAFAPDEAKIGGRPIRNK